jgi:chorismate-pyruvate lyase
VRSFLLTSIVGILMSSSTFAESRLDTERLIRLLRDSDSATKTLSAWVGSPITLRMMCQEDDHLTDAEFADLDLWSPEPVQRREVFLRGAGGRVLSVATAVVVLGRLLRDEVTALCETDVPLGLVLSRLAVGRHTLKVIRRAWATSQEVDVLFEVTARMDVGGAPVALVRERYLDGVLQVVAERP